LDGKQPLQGLTGLEAKSRLDQYGLNVLHERAAASLFWQFMKRFRNPLALILLTASAVSALTGEVTNFFIISFIVLLSVTLDFVQECKANATADALKQKVSLRATVMRDGSKQDIPDSEVVPGDVVWLSAGDLIPADGIVLEAHDFFVKQALLTGEPYPEEKHPGTLPDAANDIQDATNAVFMGTSVISGTAWMWVVKTGAKAAIGQIAEHVAWQTPPTSFEIGTKRFGVMIMGMTALMVLFVLFVNAWFHKPWLESFLFAVALAVGLTPELLPMVISVTLARGAQRMAKQQMIVKRMSAIQDLGSMDVLCTDKTGTLTQARIVMDRHVDAKVQSSDWVLKLAQLNSFFESGLKNAMDEAILDQSQIDTCDWKKLDEVPFDFERRCVSVLLDNGQDRCGISRPAEAKSCLCAGTAEAIGRCDQDRDWRQRSGDTACLPPTQHSGRGGFNRQRHRDDE
jgi:Mg2+-importing ATPase